jgi:hypothetical protein
MYRAALLLVIAIAASAACSEDPNLMECMGLDCPDHGVIRVEILVRRCDEADCRLKRLPSRREPFIEVVELNGGCGLGKCGGVPHALANEGWAAGPLRLIAPPLKGLEPPEPVTIDLEEGETERLTLIYEET